MIACVSPPHRFWLIAPVLQRLVTDGVEPLRLVIDGCQTSKPGADGVKTRQRRELSIQTVITEESFASYKQPINKPAVP